MAVRVFKPGEQYVVRLRDAMFSSQGVDHDVLRQCSAFAKYDRNDMDVILEFATGRTLSAKTRRFIFTLAKQQMEQIVEDSGEGWDDEERQDELKQDVCRYLLVRERVGRKLLGYVDFRFSVQGDIAERFEGFPALLVNDMQLVPEAQRKGLGRHMLMTLEMIARKQKLTFLLIRLYQGNEAGLTFVTEQLKGFQGDNTWIGEDDPCLVMQKLLMPADLQREGFDMPASPQAVSPPSHPSSKLQPPLEPTKAAAVPKATPLQLDAQFAASIKLGLAAPSTAAAAPQVAAAAPAPEPAVVLKFFYDTVVGEAKTKGDIGAIVAKRQGSPNWFEKLCGKLSKKYGKEPLAEWKAHAAAAAACASAQAKREHRVEQLSDQSAGKTAAAEQAEEQVPPQAETARLTAMQELSKVYTAQHGDAPSAEQLERWQQSFDAAIEGAKQSSLREATDLPSFGQQC